MFKTQSVTITSLALMLLTNVLVLFGVEISDESLTHFLQTGITIVLGITAWWGRVRIGGINWLGKRI